MTKHTVIIFLSIFIIVIAIGGFPGWARTTLLVLSGVGISVLAYLSSVVYCSNCKKLIEDADLALPVSDVNVETESISQPKKIQ